MILRLREVPLHLGEDEQQLSRRVAGRVGLAEGEIQDLKIVRRGIDARRKPDVLRVYEVEFTCKDEAGLLARQQKSKLQQVEPLPAPIRYAVAGKPRVLVVGMGPAGLFAALRLAESGVDVQLIERGETVENRLRKVREFWGGGALDPQSNAQFGEGGAGTFSDGKLNSRLNNPAMRQVLETLVRFGAPEEILWQAKPHIGSDRLRAVLIRFRKRLLDLGVVIRYTTRLDGLLVQDGKVRGGLLDNGEELACDQLVLALGHSARDTYVMLQEAGVALKAKPFAVGLRVEHPRELIDLIQFGHKNHPQLPAAEYNMAWNDKRTGRGIYTFCMCPGGVVVNASSEEGGIVVNGMSLFRRDAELSNSALVVSVKPEDFPGDDALAGMQFQRRWEREAYKTAGQGWRAPAQPLLEFLHGKGGRLYSSCEPQVVHADLSRCLPDFIVGGIRKALPYFNRRMPGFVGPEATLIGVETRTSAPLRILRGDDCQSLSHPGLYPTGEGAGYAGGIMSAAVDGLRVGEQILQAVSSGTAEA
jgi:uncharacterized protein